MLSRLRNLFRSDRRRALTVRSRLVAGRLAGNRCETLAGPAGLRVRSRLRGGKILRNRCEALAQA